MHLLLILSLLGTAAWAQDCNNEHVSPYELTRSAAMEDNRLVLRFTPLGKNGVVYFFIEDSKKALGTVGFVRYPDKVDYNVHIFEKRDWNLIKNGTFPGLLLPSFAPVDMLIEYNAGTFSIANWDSRRVCWNTLEVAGVPQRFHGQLSILGTTRGFPWVVALNCKSSEIPDNAGRC